MARKTKTAMVKKEKATIVNYDNFNGYEGMGLDSFGQQEFVTPPYLKLGQALSEVDALGLFYRSDSDEILGEEIWVVPLLVQRRMRFKVPMGEFPPCWSMDALKPSERIDEPYNPECNKLTAQGLIPVCSYAKFQGSGEERTPPACDQQWAMVLNIFDGEITEEDYNPESTMIYMGQKTGLPPMKNYIRQFRSKFRGQLPLFGVALQLQVKKIEDGKQRYYVPSYPNLRTEPERIKIIEDGDLLAALAETHNFFDEFLRVKADEQQAQSNETQSAPEDEDSEDNNNPAEDNEDPFDGKPTPRSETPAPQGQADIDWGRNG